MGGICKKNQLTYWTFATHSLLSLVWRHYVQQQPPTAVPAKEKADITNKSVPSQLLSLAANICHNDELSSSLSWLDCLLTDSEVFYLICRNEPNPSKNFYYSHSLHLHVSCSTLSKNWVVNNFKSTQTQLIIVIEYIFKTHLELNFSSFSHI